VAAAIDPRKLRPADLLRLVNATDFGSVLTEAQLRRHRNQAGYTIGDARTVDLFRYAAWLTLEYFKPKTAPLSYEEQKARQAERNAEAVRAAQDIGELPAVVDPRPQGAVYGIVSRLSARRISPRCSTFLGRMTTCASLRRSKRRCGRAGCSRWRCRAAAARRCCARRRCCGRP
jgi:hypothetical protein